MREHSIYIKDRDGLPKRCHASLREQELRDSPRHSNSRMKTPATEDSRQPARVGRHCFGRDPEDDGSQYNKVRLLVPAKVYPPNTDLAIKPPKHYEQFLRAQTADGANFSDITKLTVDGRPATLMTATTRHGLNGSIGCPDLAADQGEGCFGLQPDLALRIAVLDVGRVPVLGWARTSARPRPPPVRRLRQHDQVDPLPLTAIDATLQLYRSAEESGRAGTRDS